MSLKNQPKNASLSTKADHALTSIHGIAIGLPIDEVTKEESLAAMSGNRVSSEVMSLALTLLKKERDSFPQFDPSILEGSIEYESAMIPVADALINLGQSILRSAHKRRGQAAEETLALYHALKGLSRSSKRIPGVRATLIEMEKLLSTNHKRRSTSVTREEMLAMRKEKRKAKIAAAKQAEIDAAIDEAKAAGLDPVLPSPTPPPAAPITH